MNFLEKNLEDIIFGTPNAKLSERGLPIKGKKKRQVRIGNYGVADLVTMYKSSTVHNGKVYSTLYVTIYELKKGVVDVNTLMQACRYKKGISQYFDKRGLFQDTSVEYNLVLVGDSIQDSGDFVYCLDTVYDASSYIYKYDFDGISFSEKSGWSLTNPGF